MFLFVIYYKNGIFILHKRYFKNRKVYQKLLYLRQRIFTTKMQIYMVNLRAKNIQLITKSYIF